MHPHPTPTAVTKLSFHSKRWWRTGVFTLSIISHIKHFLQQRLIYNLYRDLESKSEDWLTKPTRGECGLLLDNISSTAVTNTWKTIIESAWLSRLPQLQAASCKQNKIRNTDWGKDHYFKHIVHCICTPRWQFSGTFQNKYWHKNLNSKRIGNICKVTWNKKPCI